MKVVPLRLQATREEEIGPGARPRRSAPRTDPRSLSWSATPNCPHRGGSCPVAALSVFPLLVIVHALAATVWTGGHLVLDLGVLPRALRAQSASQIRAFEEVFEPLGLTALAIQVLTGLWMGWIYLPGFRGLFNPANPIGMLVGVKLLLLAGTAALAVHARLRLIPNLNDDNLSGLAWHIRGITALAIAFVVVGALIRFGGLG